jgi:hypothetical protein
MLLTSLVAAVGIVLLTCNTSPAATIDALSHYSYHINNDSFLDLNNNGGLLGGGNPITVIGFYCEAPLTNKPDKLVICLFNFIN